MGRLQKIVDKGNVVWAVDLDTHQIKKLTVEVVSRSQVPDDVFDAIVDDLIQHTDLSKEHDKLE
jgi:hypothetical protein